MVLRTAEFEKLVHVLDGTSGQRGDARREVDECFDGSVLLTELEGSTVELEREVGINRISCTGSEIGPDGRGKGRGSLRSSERGRNEEQNERGPGEHGEPPFVGLPGCVDSTRVGRGVQWLADGAQAVQRPVRENRFAVDVATGDGAPGAAVIGRAAVVP